MARDEGPSVHDELNEAFMAKARQFILERMDEETVRRYLAEQAVQVLQSALGDYKTREAIRLLVDEILREQMPRVALEVLARPDFQDLFTSEVEAAAKSGIGQLAENLRLNLSQSVARRL